MEVREYLGLLEVLSDHLASAPEGPIGDVCTKLGQAVREARESLKELDTTWYILCHKRAVDDGAVYDHHEKTQLIGLGDLWLVGCSSEFLARYQLGRLHSCLGWSAGDMVTTDKQQITAEATRLAALLNI